MKPISHVSTTARFTIVGVIVLLVGLGALMFSTRSRAVVLTRPPD